MAIAQVAYENSAEAKRKLKAVKPLRWHRQDNGSYKAKGTRGHYVLFHRSPDRRHGVFPWTVALGGMRKDEIKPGGFDLKGEAQTYAAQYDAGLCGAAPVVVVGAPGGLPEGVFKGTLAGEAKRPSQDYFRKVKEALEQMGAGGYLIGDSSDYVSRMEGAGVDPTIVASVLLATHDHRHVHDCEGKHVELAEAAEARRKKRGLAPDDWMIPSLQQRLEHGQPGLGPYPTVNWPPFHIYYEGGDKYQNGPDAAGALQHFRDEGHNERVIRITAVRLTDAGPQDVGPSYDLEESAAEEAKKRLWQPDPSSGLFITKSSLTRDYWLVKGKHIEGRYPTRGEAETAARGMVDGAAEARSPKGRSRR